MQGLRCLRAFKGLRDLVVRFWWVSVGLDFLGGLGV